MRVDTALKQWATPKQVEIIDAMNTHGSLRKAGIALKLAPGTIQNSIDGLKARAARQGYAPDHDMHKTVPAPFKVKGVSTLYDHDGNVSAQWVKSTVDQQLVEQAMKAAVDALMEGVPKAKPVASPKKAIAELCNLYTVTDYHVGMRSWKPETGEDWDLAIAEKVLIAAFSHAVETAPAAKTALIAQLGDFLHFDSLMAVTPTSGFVLDADSRFSKVVAVAIKLLRIIIDTALRRHEFVIVGMFEGNHDPASSVWLRHLFGLLFENEPRVKVVDCETPFFAYQYGATMLGFHHGHLVKNAQLPLIFASRYAEMWGATTKRYCHVGHWHHSDEKEHAGMKVVQHPTLAAADAYSARHGHQALRQITTITYHLKHGEVARNTVCPEMLA